MDQKTTIAITAAAQEAAAASYAAYSGQFLPAERAYDFVRTLWREMELPGTNLKLGLLPARMPPQFKRDYARHCRLVAERLKRGLLPARVPGQSKHK